MRTWILKTEPAECGIDDIRDAPGGTLRWDGIRNYQARNFLRGMRAGDRCLVCHSGIPKPALAGSARVVTEAYPDPAQFDPQSPWHDPRATPDAPRWLAVDIRFEARFEPPLPVEALRAQTELQGLLLLRQGRLSVSPVEDAEWCLIRSLLGPAAP